MGNTPLTSQSLFSHRPLCSNMNALVTKSDLRVEKQNKTWQRSERCEKSSWEMCVFADMCSVLSDDFIISPVKSSYIMAAVLFHTSGAGKPWTSALEVTRWHQTCICKSTFTLHRLYFSPLPPNLTQRLLSDGWPVTMTENLSQKFRFSRHVIMSWEKAMEWCWESRGGQKWPIK